MRHVLVLDGEGVGERLDEAAQPGAADDADARPVWRHRQQQVRRRLHVLITQPREENGNMSNIAQPAGRKREHV